MISKEEIDKIFERGTIAEVIPNKEGLTARLLKEEPFKIYLGIDPTSDKLHLGHIQNILFLEDMRRAGVKVILLFGLFTGLIGDPSGKSSTRKELNQKDVLRNVRSWKKQVSPILNIKPFSGAKISNNAKWFNVFSAVHLLKLMRETTIQHLIERDSFDKRLKGGDPIYAHELVYPLLQGYDSVAMKVDAELCGTDQTFNALMGRTLSKRFLNKEKFIIAMKLIEGDGILMSKSNNTGVFVDISSGGEHRMFGSVMALHDSYISPLFRGCTRVPMKEVLEIEKLSGKENRDAKIRLAFEIVRMFHGEQKANSARNDYIKQFSAGETPDNIEDLKVENGESIISVIERKMGRSKSDIKRLIEDGAVQINGEKIKDKGYVLNLSKDNENILKVGRNIFKLKVK